jgi:hypothetical protein
MFLVLHYFSEHFCGSGFSMQNLCSHSIQGHGANYVRILVNFVSSLDQKYSNRNYLEIMSI